MTPEWQLVPQIARKRSMQIHAAKVHDISALKSIYVVRMPCINIDHLTSINTAVTQL